MADRSLAPLSDWLAGPHPSCNGRFVVPRRSVCTRLHASGSLDNPVPSRSPTPSSHPPPTWPTDHPRHSRRPPSPRAYLELYQNIITGCRVYTCMHTRLGALARAHVPALFVCARVYLPTPGTLIHLRTEVSESSWPAGHFLPLQPPSPPGLALHLLLLLLSSSSHHSVKSPLVYESTSLVRW